jgi:hypothetical protein
MQTIDMTEFAAYAQAEWDRDDAEDRQEAGFERYRRLVAWARDRYSRRDTFAFVRIERAAFAKYLA